MSEQNEKNTQNAAQNNKYDAQKIEQEYYKIWEERGYFKLDSNAKIQNGKTFSIMMPPPNITGALHMGHALTYTLQDIITRFKRMDGYKVLWQPGIDHAGIATQNVVERQLLARGIKKEQIGREAFLREVWKWKEESGGTIFRQLRRLGVSPAWDRARFTMDKGLQNAVKHAFVKWYNDGLIVQDNYMVNWCTHDGALSDIEVEYEENKGKLYYLKYFIVDSAADSAVACGDSGVESKRNSDFIVVATTRPETYFGDTAVMVNPQDSRYKHLIGKKVRLPLINREVEIIGDTYVDMEFGTGCVKVTPSHDVNDYEVGKRHNLEFITIFDKSGILNDFCGEFVGMERLEARDKIVAALERGGFVEKIEDYTNQVGKCYRCGNVVEPYISKQWFVKNEIAKETIKNVNNGELRFYPPQWINNFNAWMNELRDWCISRQLWWGHRIPVFYCECGEKIASIKDSEKCKICGKEMEQDPDVLDTWFSSGLWAFSTLGWGNLSKNDDEESSIKSLYNDRDLEDFYPNSLLITSFDILFFWVARMLFSGQNLLGKLPFRDVYLHALVVDKNGKKMSKSRGNVINPLDLIEKYSSDILRFSLAYYCVQGRDIRIGDSSLEIGNALSVKILNALNFLMLYKAQQSENLAACKNDNNSECGEFVALDKIKSPLGIYMKSRLQNCINEMRNALESYRFNDAAGNIYRFLFNDFCDWGIEFVKADKLAVFELGSIFGEAMKLLHPFMPFLSEYVWQSLRGMELADSSSIMIERFPQAYKSQEQGDFEVIKDIITTIRRSKIVIDFANKSIPLAYVKLNCPFSADLEKLINAFVPKLAKVGEVKITQNKVEKSVLDIGEYCEIYLPTENINLSELIAKLEKRKVKIIQEIEKLEGMLKNEKFIANAPKELVESNQAALNEAVAKKEKIDNELAVLNV